MNTIATDTLFFIFNFLKRDDITLTNVISYGVQFNNYTNIQYNNIDT